MMTYVASRRLVGARRAGRRGVAALVVRHWETLNHERSLSCRRRRVPENPVRIPVAPVRLKKARSSARMLVETRPCRPAAAVVDTMRVESHSRPGRHRKSHGQPFII